MRYVIAHAYSSTNSGDGLLVEEAIRLIEEVDERAEVIVLALDPDSFTDRANVRFVHPFTGEARSASNTTVLRAALISVLRGLRLPQKTSRLLDEADLIVGVGGGYMRGANAVEALKMVLAHLPQLATANRSATPAVYLPQSVGALRWGTQALVRTHGANIVWHVRDDRSLSLLEGSATVRRTPDTAVLPLGSMTVHPRIAAETEDSATFGLVARSLHSTRTRMARYVDAIRRTVASLHARPLLQASARGNNDDRFYSETLGRAAESSLIQATSSTADDRPHVIVSVRLHGAIQSIRNGVPAIHLSYERKGWGAYEDLGIAEYVHNAFDFDPDLVRRQALALSTDSSGYWNAVAERAAHINGARETLLADLRVARG
ncbi:MULTISPECIES: polysaccharide pyruvyl transferase family protein [Microbacterium]|uniref:polysaccharide pyruvyl transferase family protein n=1 Tax=Microbacterium TaxID=33882 RepID=UPI00277F68E5|nr:MULTISPECIES: polysaccharide pyruvyl transferase family protein [Microbacterium]MDQ1083860.1 polysaccharide pyruvyl transferase WcaK-like protein [Microbacterium sp. SORGH_AS_0344]MDQ1170861.1 polysaccharide pyruvyl transferase WcaK-like protein [Microbacterium proteolyticum]